MHFVPARGDRTEVEPSVGGPEVAQRDVGPGGHRMEPCGVDAADPHAAVVGHQCVECRRAVVPRQAVQLLVVGDGVAALGLFGSAHDDRVAARGVVFDPGQRLARRNGVERMAAAREDARGAVGEVHPAELRADPLLEELRAAVLGPPDAAVARDRTGRDRSRAGERPLGPRAGVDRHEARRTVVVLFQHQSRRVVERQRPPVGGIVALRHRDQRTGALFGNGQRGPVALQIVERFAEERRDVGAVVFLERDARGRQHVGVARAEAGHFVPDVLAVAVVGVGADLVAQLVVVGHVVAVRAAEPFVDVPAVAAPAVGADAAQGPVADRERGLQPPAERRHRRFGHHGVALHGPDGHAEQSDGRPLLSEQVAQHADHAPVEVVVLYGVAVFVGHELLEPRHRVAVDGRRREKLHALGQVHDQTVRPEVLGVHDERNAHRAVGEAFGDGGLHGADVEERAPRHGVHRVGEDHPHVGRADRRPLHRSVRAPGVVLRRGVPHPAEQARDEQRDM